MSTPRRRTTPPSWTPPSTLLRGCNTCTLSPTFRYLHTSQADYASLLDTALDIAAGMQHLHSANIVHSDLKV